MQKERKSQKLGRVVSNTVFLTWYGNYNRKVITYVVPSAGSVTIPSFMAEELSRFYWSLKEDGQLVGTGEAVPHLSVVYSWIS